MAAKKTSLIGNGNARYGIEPTSHPSQRFVAPRSIQRGVPLANLLDANAITLIGESFANVWRDFDPKRFKRNAVGRLERLGGKSMGLMERAGAIAEALAEELPPNFSDAASHLIASFGPELSQTEGNGLAPFFYLPHSQFIGRYGVNDVPTALDACHAITKRFSAEFCIRPLLADQPRVCLRRLASWVNDSDPHVRRLVSEGTRPRLPWGMRLKAFQEDPTPTLKLLEKLKDDTQAYVYRSVANHLGDILKDQPELGYAVCERWIDEVEKGEVKADSVESRLWLLCHALRFPANRGVERAVDLRARAKAKRLKKTYLRTQSKDPSPH